jgi:sterol 24-C-methyltransferase
VTLTLEVAWNKKFHFAPFLDDKQSLRVALAAHDHYQFMTMGVKPGMRGLDAGCGVGEPAREFAKWADVSCISYHDCQFTCLYQVHITGVTITDYQVYRANLHAEKEGISDKVEFVRADFCVRVIPPSYLPTHLTANTAFQKMPFPDNTFDFAYAQEATVYAAELRDVYTEMCRVLKPSGVMSMNEWCMTDKFDPKDPQHLDIRRRLERGDDIVNMRTVKEAIAEFQFAGLDVLHMEDHALKGLQSGPWWIPLDGDTSTFSEWSEWMMEFCLKPAVWKALKAWVWFKIKVGLYNKINGDSTMESLNTQAKSVFGLRDAGKMVSRLLCCRLTMLYVDEWLAH